ncbi:hypothetical protein F4818DRAFT_442182 [Hypoxylon cercidicola]|nr:hypothetical protein F4818DRAFT_442182 [Hypoxylon cercidicola]
MIFHISHTHDLLVNLRQQVDEISFQDPSKKLEYLFDGSMVCIVDDSQGYYNAYSSSGVPVTIHRLATTSTARTVAGDDDVIPALNSTQMDRFMEERCPQQLISAIPYNDQQIIKQAWKCAYWISVLFNWNANEIYCDALTTLGVRKPAGLKNLVLELMYSIVYRVQELTRTLLQSVTSSLQSQVSQLYDPWTTSYAVLIVYYTIKKSKLLKWDAKELGALVRKMKVSQSQNLYF